MREISVVKKSSEPSPDGGEGRIGIFAAILFAKTRTSWAESWKGGATFGFWLSLTAFFANFYYPLVLEGFPYYLSWCWGGINVIEGVIGGAVLGLIYKRP